MIFLSGFDQQRFWCGCFPLKSCMCHSPLKKKKMFQQGLFVSIFTATIDLSHQYTWSQRSSKFFGFPLSFDRWSSLPILMPAADLSFTWWFQPTFRWRFGASGISLEGLNVSTHTTYTGPIPNPYLYPKLCLYTPYKVPKIYYGQILLPWWSWERKYLPYKNM